MEPCYDTINFYAKVTTKNTTKDKAKDTEKRDIISYREMMQKNSIRLEVNRSISTEISMVLYSLDDVFLLSCNSSSGLSSDINVTECKITSPNINDTINKLRKRLTGRVYDHLDDFNFEFTDVSVM
jgi:hypothetical protein